MRSARALAAAYVAVVFGVVSYILLGVERGMGFVTPGDYFDPIKVTAGYASGAWRVSTALYLTLPPALFVLAKTSARQRVSEFGLASAGFGLFLGTLDLVGIQLASFLSNEAQLHAAVAALIPVRFAVLKTTVMMLGLFAWGTTNAAEANGVGGRSWRVLGWIVLALSVIFLFVFVPVPIAFFVWALVLTVNSARHGGGRLSTHVVASTAPERPQPAA